MDRKPERLLVAKKKEKNRKKSKITWDFYTPPIDIHCNHQRRLNHKIQRNGGVGNERF